MWNYAVDQAGLELTEICLLLPPTIKGMCHHCPAQFMDLLKGPRAGEMAPWLLWGVHQRRLLGHGLKPIESLYWPAGDYTGYNLEKGSREVVVHTFNPSTREADTGGSL